MSPPFVRKVIAQPERLRMKVVLPLRSFLSASSGVSLKCVTMASPAPRREIGPLAASRRMGRSNLSYVGMGMMKLLLSVLFDTVNCSRPLRELAARDIKDVAQLGEEQPVIGTFGSFLVGPALDKLCDLVGVGHGRAGDWGKMR